MRLETMNANYLCPIELYRRKKNPVSLRVSSKDDETFVIHGMTTRIVCRDEELKPDENGKIIISLEPLMSDMRKICGDIEPPKEFEMPQEILESRAEKRRLNALAKGVIEIIEYQGEKMYFYLEGKRLRILKGDREAIATKTEIIHGKKAVDVKKLKLGHPYLELPVDVCSQFEKVLHEEELKKLALVPAGRSMLNGREYYRLNMDIPAYMWEQVEGMFDDFGEVGELTGWLTCDPTQVAEVLKIPLS